MAFHDVNFPLGLARGASGGPGHLVEIVSLASGREHRHTAQSRALRRFNAVTGVTSLDEARLLSDFYAARSGPLHSFRFRDPFDHAAEDEAVEWIDATTAQLVKRYGETVRPITKPVTGTVALFEDGAPISASVNHLTGQVSFASAPSDIVTASFTFDVPVRFGSDQLNLRLDSAGAVRATDVPLVEVFDDA